MSEYQTRQMSVAEKLSCYKGMTLSVHMLYMNEFIF